jgi:hypothetical protein
VGAKDLAGALVFPKQPASSQARGAYDSHDSQLRSARERTVSGDLAPVSPHACANSNPSLTLLLRSSNVSVLQYNHLEEIHSGDHFRSVVSE